MSESIQSAVSIFGASAKQKLANLAASGEPEDQLRAPFERLLGDMAELAHISRAKVAAVGESSLHHLKTWPNYAVTVHGALVDAVVAGIGGHDFRAVGALTGATAGKAKPATDAGPDLFDAQTWRQGKVAAALR